MAEGRPIAVAHRKGVCLRPLAPAAGDQGDPGYPHPPFHRFAHDVLYTASVKVIERIPRAHPGTGLVDCIVQEAGFRELGNWQRLIHEPFIATDPTLDRTWNWPRYLTASYLLNDVHGD